MQRYKKTYYSVDEIKFNYIGYSQYLFRKPIVTHTAVLWDSTYEV